MTADEIYKRVERDFDSAVKSYKVICSLIRGGGAGEQAASSALNTVISVGWRLKDAAMLKEPAPFAPRASQQRKKDRKDAEKGDEH